MELSAEEAKRIFEDSELTEDDFPIYFCQPDYDRFYKLTNSTKGVRVSRVSEEKIDTHNGHRGTCYVFNRLCEHLAQGTCTPITPNEFYEQFDEVAGKLRNI